MSTVKKRYTKQELVAIREAAVRAVTQGPAWIHQVLTAPQSAARPVDQRAARAAAPLISDEERQRFAQLNTQFLARVERRMLEKAKAEVEGSATGTSASEMPEIPGTGGKKSFAQIARAMRDPPDLSLPSQPLPRPAPTKPTTSANHGDVAIHVAKQPAKKNDSSSQLKGSRRRPDVPLLQASWAEDATRSFFEQFGAPSTGVAAAQFPVNTSDWMLYLAQLGFNASEIYYETAERLLSQLPDEGRQNDSDGSGPGAQRAFTDTSPQQRSATDWYSLPGYYPVPVPVPVDREGNLLAVGGMENKVHRKFKVLMTRGKGIGTRRRQLLNWAEGSEFFHDYISDRKRCGVPPKSVEQITQRDKQRERQIRIGTSTLGYKVFAKFQTLGLTLPPKSEGKPPNVHQNCSKRSWDGQVRRWRQMLHDFDKLALQVFTREELEEIQAKKPKTNPEIALDQPVAPSNGPSDNSVGISKKLFED